MAKKCKNKLNGKVDLTRWELPKTIDFKVWNELGRLCNDLQDRISKTADEHLKFEDCVKQAASEALQYALKEWAYIDFLQDKNPRIIKVGFPLGSYEGDAVEWEVNLLQEVKRYFIHRGYDERCDELVKVLKEAADYLESKKNKEN